MKNISLMVASRLQLVLDGIENPLQFEAFPETGCLDGSFSFCSLLQTREEHNLYIWVVIVELMKQFDSINPNLFALRKNFGIPTRPLHIL